MNLERNLHKEKQNKKNIFHNRGSFLLEAILSVVILATCITIVIQSLVSSLRAIVYGRDYTRAILLAEGKMLELIQQGFIDDNFKEEGEFLEPQSRYGYIVEAQTQDGLKTNLNKVNVGVHWKSGSRKSQINLETFLLSSSAVEDDG